jgi:phage terminase small subunit
MSDDVANAVSELTHGPAMQALTERQRNFVLAMAADPFGSQTDWAKSAGYQNSEGGFRVQACVVMAHPKVKAAVLEVAKQLLHTVGPIVATNALLRAAADPTDRNHIKAAELIANRAGLHEVQEIHVHKTDDTFEAKLGRMKQLAEFLGIDPQQIAGANKTKVIDVTPAKD